MLLLHPHAVLMLVEAPLTREPLLLLDATLNQALTWVPISLHVLSTPPHLCYVDLVINSLALRVRLVNFKVECQSGLPDAVLDLFL